MNFAFSPRQRSRTPALAALLVAGGVGASIIAHSALSQDSSQAPAAREQLRHAIALSEAFKQVTKSVAPAVVHIRSTQTITPTEQPGFGGQTPFDEDTLRRFFPDLPEGFQFGPSLPQQPFERQGQGTGVIVRADGYIITNNHVVAGADEIKVRLDDDREYTASVIGTDPDTDVAVVRIDADDLTVAKMGDSDRIEPGEWVLAMGSPFGLQHTVTAGIVSAKGRGNMGLATFEDFIQTDAAINPGNSGGPLLNVYGEMIGMNTAISTRTGVYNGVGFAIPSNMIQSVMTSIIESGGVQRGALGVGIGPLDEKLAERFGYSSTSGVLITQVYPDSAAQQAGIEVYDIVTKIDERSVPDTQTFLNAIARHKPDDKVTLEVFRDGSPRTFEVTLGDRAKQFAGILGRGDETGSDWSREPGTSDLGLTVQELTPEIASQLNAEGREGVVVARVKPNTPAFEEGLARGDIIARVDETSVTSVEEFEQAMAKGDPSKGIALQVFRAGAARVVVLKTDENRD